MIIRRLALFASATLLVACSSTGDERQSGAAVGSSLGVPVLTQEPPAPNTVRTSPQGGLFTPTPPPFGAPRGSSQPQAAVNSFERSRTTERTNVDGDGTIRTTRTTTTIGFNSERAGAALERLTSGAPTGGVAGSWRMQSSSTGSICEILLHGTPSDTSGAASSSGCGTGSIFAGLSAWSFSGGRLTLARGGSEIMTLSQQGPNRFDGSATWGFLSTRIALYR